MRRQHRHQLRIVEENAARHMPLAESHVFIGPVPWNVEHKAVPFPKIAEAKIPVHAADPGGGNATTGARLPSPEKAQTVKRARLQSDSSRAPVAVVVSLSFEH